MSNFLKLSDYEKGWIVGIMEGEGSFYVHRCQKPYKDKVFSYKYPTVQLNMTDKDVVSTFKEVMGLHQNIHVYDCKIKGQEHFKPAYSIRVGGKEGSLIMLDMFPYMHSRRRERIQDIILDI